MEIKDIVLDSNGKPSSKRVLGIIGMAFFFGISIFCILYSVLNKIEIYNAVVDLVIAVGIVSGSLLGVGVAESIVQKITSKISE